MSEDTRYHHIPVVGLSDWQKMEARALAAESRATAAEEKAKLFETLYLDAFEAVGDVERLTGELAKVRKERACEQMPPAVDAGPPKPRVIYDTMSEMKSKDGGAL